MIVGSKQVVSRKIRASYKIDLRRSSAWHGDLGAKIFKEGEHRKRLSITANRTVVFDDFYQEPQ